MRTAWADAKLTLTAPLGAIGTSEFLLRRCGGPPSPGLRPTSPPSGRGGRNEKPLANRLYVAKEMIGPLACAGTRLRRVVFTVKKGDSTPSIQGRRFAGDRRNQPTQSSAYEWFAL